jgi:hypothetical protein
MLVQQELFEQVPNTAVQDCTYSKAGLKVESRARLQGLYRGFKACFGGLYSIFFKEFLKN